MDGVRFLVPWGALAAAGCGASVSDSPDPSTIPEQAACDQVRAWDSTLAAFEDATLEEIRNFRAVRPTCPDGTKAAGAVPVVEDGTLRCAARIHAADMAESDFVAHEGSDGSQPPDRVVRAGGSFALLHEAVLAGVPTPHGALDLLSRDEDVCGVLLDPAYDRVGVGYAARDGATYDGYLVVLLGGTEAAGTGASSGGAGSGSGG